MWSIAILFANFPYFFWGLATAVGSSAEPMGPALEFAHAEMLASVAEAEARYVVKDQATEYEMPRMKAPGPGKLEKGIWDEMFLFLWNVYIYIYIDIII